MKTLKFETKEEWLEARKQRITGSRAEIAVPKKRGEGRKIGFYELIAERVALDSDGENPMNRGTRLEEEAINRFEAVTGKKVDRSLVIWTRDDNENIAVSPDGSIDDSEAIAIATTGTRESIIEAVETKCLNSARHIEAWLTKQIPSEYKTQKIQYFVVNEKLQKLHFCFYDPLIPVKDFFYFTITRDEIQAEIDEHLEYQRQTLEEVERIVNDLTF